MAPEPLDPPFERKVTFCVRGVISPILSNVFLHHVLDEWFEREAKPRLSGACVSIGAQN